MKRKTILVIGDVMLDEYIFGDITRKSPEAPKTPVILAKNKKVILGGAANVAANVVSLGGKAILVGAIGKDEHGKDLQYLLRKKNIIDYTFKTDSRPTTIKTRIFNGSCQHARVDIEHTSPLSLQERRQLAAALNKLPHIDFVIISDYAKGVFTKDTMRIILKKFPGNKIIADAKPIHKNILHNLRAITPNLKELSLMSGINLRKHDHIRETAAKLASELNTSIIATMGHEGMIVCDKNGMEFHRVPAPKVKAVDVTGAGDVATAACALALASDESLSHAAEFANKAASISVTKSGTSTVMLSELKTSRKITA